MGSLVKIEDRKVTPMFYRKRPVVTLRQVDEFHGRPRNTAARNFYKNRKHFVKEEDFFEVPYEEYSQLFDSTKFVESKANDGTNFVPSKGGSRVPMIFLTETGYLMLVKSLTDDKAWAIHRDMVKVYFNKKQPPKPLTAEEVEAFNADVLELGTKATALKHGRSESTVRKFTAETRAAKAEQVSLFQ